MLDIWGGELGLSSLTPVTRKLGVAEQHIAASRLVKTRRG